MGEVSLMSQLVTALTSIISTDAFLTNLTALLPAIGGLIVFAFTYRIIRHVIKGASKGKASI